MFCCDCNRGLASTSQSTHSETITSHCLLFHCWPSWPTREPDGAAAEHQQSFLHAETDTPSPPKPKLFLQMTCITLVPDTHFLTETSANRAGALLEWQPKCHSVFRVCVCASVCRCALLSLLCVLCFHVRGDASHLGSSEGGAPSPQHASHTQTGPHTHTHTQTLQRFNTHTLKHMQLHSFILRDHNLCRRSTS